MGDKAEWNRLGEGNSVFWHQAARRVSPQCHSFNCSFGTDSRQQPWDTWIVLFWSVFRGTKDHTARYWWPYPCLQIPCGMLYLYHSITSLQFQQMDMERLLLTPLELIVPDANKMGLKWRNEICDLLYCLLLQDDNVKLHHGRVVTDYLRQNKIHSISC